MKRSITTKYALHSLGRHKRRTLLSVIGIGLGSAVCLFVIAFVRGESQMMLSAAAECGNGHLRMVPGQWPEKQDNNLRLADWQRCLEQARTTPGVRVATPHARTEGLLSFGIRSHGVQIIGVDPNTEQQSNRLVRTVTAGTYFAENETGTTVVGQAVATRLDVELDDELLVTVAGQDGEIRRAMLRIVGIISTGSKDLDSTICHIPLHEMEALTGLAGAGDITLLINEPRQLDTFIRSFEKDLPTDAMIITWKEIVPELASGTEIDKTWTRLVVTIIMLVVLLGIASAQLTAVLERRREFAVLSALGMRMKGLMVILMIEGLILGLLGGVLGLVLGGSAAYWVATYGIDFSKLYGDMDWAMSNILIDPVFYGDFGWWLIPLAFELAVSATLLSSFYPAWYASKTDPATALRVEH
jgi:ABC-type lipoprotein release transport system permease subunit